MAHSLLNYILHDDEVTPLNIKPQQIVLSSLKNPILRALFKANLDPGGFITEENDICRLDLWRLVDEDKAKPEQYNYAATTIQSWFQDINFEIARDSTTMTADVPYNTMCRRFQERLKELDDISRKLKSKTGIILDNCVFREFDSTKLFEKFLGDAVRDYQIPYAAYPDHMEVC